MPLWQLGEPEFLRKVAARLGLVVLLLVILALFISQTQSDGWLTLWFLLFIFVGIPLLILSWVDLGRAIRGAQNQTRLLFTLGILFGFPQAVFGILAMICGISIIGWVVYNAFVKRQPEYGGGFLTFGIGPAAQSTPAARAVPGATPPGPRPGVLALAAHDGARSVTPSRSP